MKKEIFLLVLMTITTILQAQDKKDTLTVTRKDVKVARQAVKPVTTKAPVTRLQVSPATPASAQIKNTGTIPAPAPASTQTKNTGIPPAPSPSSTLTKNTGTAPAPAPAQSKPSGANPGASLTDAEYFLAGGLVTIYNAGDNKEANTSTASFYIRPRKSAGVVAYKLEGYANEIPIWSETPLRLDRIINLTAKENSLQYYKQNGFFIAISYCNKNFCTDAWNINGVTVTLEFKDKNGNPAPAGDASRTIDFSSAKGILGFRAGANPLWVTDGKNCYHSDQLQKIILKTDQYFNPLPAQFVTYITDDIN